MKYLVIAGLLLAGCTAPQQPTPTPTLPATTPTAAVTTPSGWTTFESPDGRFSMLMPGTVDVQEEEGSFEVSSLGEPGPKVEIDYDKFATAKLAAKTHEEKVKDARAGGKIVAEQREGNRVVLKMEDKKGGSFSNALVLVDDHVLDVMAVGAPDDVDRLIASLKIK